MKATYYQQEVVRSGCHICDGDYIGNPSWSGKNGQACAARHHQTTGHPTFVDLEVTIGYGERANDA